MKIGLKILLVIQFILLCFPFCANAQTEKTSKENVTLDQELLIGEEFIYLVKYAFINLGEIKIKVYKKDKFENKTIYKAIAHINSYEGLPFVNIHQIYESWFDSTLHPVYFQAYIFDEGDTSYTKYYFLGKDRVHVIRGKTNQKKPTIDTVKTLRKQYQDGLSLLFFARFNPGGSEESSIPCFINEDTSTTLIHYYSERESLTIDANESEIECFNIDGETNFTGIFGLTGYFEGWFSDDKYKIPISANLQVIIGDISVELMDWNNNKWQPPLHRK